MLSVGIKPADAGMAFDVAFPDHRHEVRPVAALRTTKIAMLGALWESDSASEARTS
jgi:hypothetical protein